MRDCTLSYSATSISGRPACGSGRKPATWLERSPPGGSNCGGTTGPIWRVIRLSTRLSFWSMWKYGIQGGRPWRADAYWYFGELGTLSQLGAPTDCWWSKGQTEGLGGGSLSYPIPGLAASAFKRLGWQALPSIRLEPIRDGLEDYEYFVLLRTLVERAQTRGVEAPQLPKPSVCWWSPDDRDRCVSRGTANPVHPSSGTRVCASESDGADERAAVGGRPPLSGHGAGMIPAGDFRLTRCTREAGTRRAG